MNKTSYTKLFIIARIQKLFLNILITYKINIDFNTLYIKVTNSNHNVTLV